MRNVGRSKLPSMPPAGEGERAGAAGGFHSMVRDGRPGHASAMPLLKVVSPLVVVGVVLWLLNPCIPMQSTIKTILNFVVVVAVIIRLIYGSFGIITRRDIAHDSVRMMPAPAVAQSPPQGVRARL